MRRHRRHYRLFTSSSTTWDAMLDAIRHARRSVYLEMYIFLDDTTHSHDFITALHKKALAGVRVVLVLDAFGSKTFQVSEAAKALRAAGVEIIFYSHWFRHTHRKLLIVDETIAFLGGVNIARSFASWSDLQIRVTGKLFVNRLLASFASTYAIAGGERSDILMLQKKPSERKLKWWVVDHWPVRNVHSLREHYTERINQAQRSIRIVTPYLVPPRWLISLLDSAVRRGVAVEVLIPRESEQVNRINYYYAKKLQAIGIRFFLSKKMNHSKLLLIDDEIGLVGSQNLDVLSFHMNAEIGVFFQDKEILHDLQSVWQHWRAEAIPFSANRHSLRFIDYLILIGLKILHPIL